MNKLRKMNQKIKAKIIRKKQNKLKNSKNNKSSELIQDSNVDLS